MFPEALFVFSLRAPWPTIQSATLKGNSSYIVRTQFVNRLPHDIFLRAAASWAESIDVLMREWDLNWIAIRHEDLIAKPHNVISNLYAHVGFDQELVRTAEFLPERRPRDYSLIKYRMMGHPFKEEILSFLKDRAHAVNYTADLDALPGSVICGAVRLGFRQIRQIKKMCSYPTSFLRPAGA
jgi:hypothetical protein